MTPATMQRRSGFFWRTGPRFVIPNEHGIAPTAQAAEACIVRSKGHAGETRTLRHENESTLFFVLSVEPDGRLELLGSFQFGTELGAVLS